MNCIYYAIGLLIGLVAPAYISAETAGISFMALFDLVSLLVVLVAPYFICAGASNSLTFYKKDMYLEMFGDLTLKFGFIGTLMGLIFILGGMAVPPEPGVDPAAKLGASLAVAIITPFYGMLFKYVLVVPWLASRKK